jgi:hypothetical protein
MANTDRTGLDALCLNECGTELERLRAIEATARRYYLGYVRDEAEDPELGVPGQHEDAVALRTALGL